MGGRDCQGVVNDLVGSYVGGRDGQRAASNLVYDLVGSYVDGIGIYYIESHRT